MNDIKRHLRFRMRHSALANISILVLFLMSITIGNPPSFAYYSTKQLTTTTFESIYHGDFLPIYFVLIIVVNVYMLYRNYHRTKERWLLLPQSRMSILYGDILWMIMIFLCIYLLQFIMYTVGFQHFLSVMAEKEIINFNQTSDLFTSLSRSSIAMWYSFDFLAILKLCLIGVCGAIMTSLMIAQLLVEHSKRWQIWIGGSILVVLLYVCSITLYDSITCLCLLVAIVYFFKITKDCWNHQLGG